VAPQVIGAVHGGVVLQMVDSISAERQMISIVNSAS